MAEAVGKRVVHGAVLMVLVKFMDRGLGLVSTLILARVLVPADFGVVAMAMAVVAFFELISTLGVDVALIQNRNATREHFDTAWTINNIVCTLMALFAVIIAPIASHLYGDERVQSLLYVLAISMFVSGFENIGVVAFRRDLTFGKEFTYWTVRKVLGMAVTLTLAWTLRSYWALVLGALFSRCVGVALSYILHPFRPRWSFAAKADILGVSKWMLVNSFFGFINMRIFDFILGRNIGATSVGTYSVANEMATIPTLEIAAGIQRAVFPGYAKLGGDPAAITAGHVLVTNALAAFSVPAAIGMALVSSTLVPVVLGSQWLSAISLLQILPFAALALVFFGNNFYLFLASGKQKAAAKLTGLHSLLLIATVPWSVRHYGADGAAYAAVVSSWLALCGSMAVLESAVGCRPLPLIRQLGRPIAASAVMAMVLLGIQASWAGAGSAFGLIVVVVCGIVTYTVGILALWAAAGQPEGVERLCVSYLNQYRVR